MPGEIRRIADFLDIEFNDDKIWSTILEHSSFEYMKDNASRLSPMLDQIFEGGAKSFVNKGTNGRWRDVLTPADIQKYEEIANSNLTEECSQWLITGEMPNKSNDKQ